MTVPPIFIAVPAWGTPYVELATRYTIPATVASLKAAGCHDATFLIHTDSPKSFRGALRGWNAEYRGIPDSYKPRPDWDKFIACHREAIAATPKGAILALLNADIVVSIETYGFVRSVLTGRTGKRVIGSFGIRTDVDKGKPPIGADADTLGRWIWSHRHSITEELIWGTGCSGLPTQLFFDDGKGNVTTHGFYMVPMFILKDARAVSFDNTIDDDLFANYADDEIHFMTKGEAIFAELSRSSKHHKVRTLLDIPTMVQFGRGRAGHSHLRNFRQPIRVLGREPDRNETIETIYRGIRAGRRK